MNKQLRHFGFGAVMVCLVISISHAAERQWEDLPINWDRDVREAWKSAVQVNRPLLVFITMDGCLYCEKMKRTTLKDRQVVYDLQHQFVPVTLNVKDAPDLVELLKIKSFPTTVVIHTNGDVIESLSGYQTSRQLRQSLQATLRVVARERAASRRR